MAAKTKSATLGGDTKTGERIARRLAHAGLCSRREAERWIEAGRVAIDGRVLTSPAENVIETSRITVDGKAIPDKARLRVWRYHKPSGRLTTHHDPQRRPTVFEALPADMPHVISIGRLDMTSEGLLLLTTDGDLSRRLELPATGWTRRYRARVFGTPNPAMVAKLAKGVTVDGERFGPIKATIDRGTGDRGTGHRSTGQNAWLTLSLAEGRNREIRRVLEHFGLRVNRLIRIAYGPFQLGNLARGVVEEVPPRVLRDQLGLKAPRRKRG